MRDPTKEEILAASGAERLALHTAARATLGEREGDTLMAITAPADQDIATRQDLVHSSETMRSELAIHDQRMQLLVTRAMNRMLVQTIAVVGVIQAAGIGYLTVVLR